MDRPRAPALDHGALREQGHRDAAPRRRAAAGARPRLRPPAALPRVREARRRPRNAARFRALVRRRAEERVPVALSHRRARVLVAAAGGDARRADPAARHGDAGERRARRAAPGRDAEFSRPRPRHRLGRDRPRARQRAAARAPHRHRRLDGRARGGAEERRGARPRGARPLRAGRRLRARGRRALRRRSPRTRPTWPRPTRPASRPSCATSRRWRCSRPATARPAAAHRSRGGRTPPAGRSCSRSSCLPPGGRRDTMPSGGGLRRGRGAPRPAPAASAQSSALRREGE